MDPTATAPARAEGIAPPEAPVSAGRAAARNTAIFSVLTGLSRIAGLAREIVASSYFATSGAFSAFTIAFQLPNVVRSLFADAALSAAFVPVFTEMLEHGRRKDAFRLASTLFFLMLTVLGAITVLFIACAGFVMPLFIGSQLAADPQRRRPALRLCGRRADRNRRAVHDGGADAAPARLSPGGVVLVPR